jgi:Xaa-Pro aminopeptidase
VHGLRSGRRRAAHAHLGAHVGARPPPGVVRDEANLGTDLEGQRGEGPHELLGDALLAEEVAHLLGDDPVEAGGALVELGKHRVERLTRELQIPHGAAHAVGPLAQALEADLEQALHEIGYHTFEAATGRLGLVEVPGSRLAGHPKRVPPAARVVKCERARAGSTNAPLADRERLLSAEPIVTLRGAMSAEFQRRRQRVRDALGDGVLVVFAAPATYRNNDVEQEWRQDSDFFYLSGFDEPESVLVLRGGSEPRFVLFVRARDPEREAWDGPRAGVEGAVADFGADAAYPLGELSERLPELLGNVASVHYALGRVRANDDVVLRALEGVRRLARRGVGCPEAIVDPRVVLHEQRLLKTPDEIASMERAVAITGAGHRAVMEKTRPGMFEYEAEAILRSAFREQGSERHAYPPIVGSGPNATILHYRKNDRRMQDGDLLLVDAGSEYDYYASDVTRTFPVNGRFTPPQRAIYELVLAAELAAIDAVRPGVTLDDVHAVAAKTLVAGLVDLGLVEGPHAEALEAERHKPWFMHRTSHWLGMDVHDVGSYYAERKPRPLVAGMVLTVEPGLYFTARDERVREEFRGIGVRIEDDVLVTEAGSRVLSESIPKHLDAVEQACSV